LLERCSPANTSLLPTTVRTNSRENKRNAKAKMPGLPCTLYTIWRRRATCITCKICRAERGEDEEDVILVNGSDMELHLREVHGGMTTFAYWAAHVKQNEASIEVITLD
jgi:hypothetical protein